MHSFRRLAATAALALAENLPVRIGDAGLLPFWMAEERAVVHFQHGADEGQRAVAGHREGVDLDHH